MEAVVEENQSVQRSGIEHLNHGFIDTKREVLVLEDCGLSSEPPEFVNRRYRARAPDGAVPQR